MPHSRGAALLCHGELPAGQRVRVSVARRHGKGDSVFHTAARWVFDHVVITVITLLLAGPRMGVLENAVCGSCTPLELACSRTPCVKAARRSSLRVQKKNVPCVVYLHERPSVIVSRSSSFHLGAGVAR